MLLEFRLAWLKPGTRFLKGFKIEPAGLLFKEYVDRISKFNSCEVTHLSKNEKKNSDVLRWICDRQGKAVSSETLAAQLQTVLDQGNKKFEIVIGGPDGFSNSEIEALKPNFKWSFGPLTLPHELAAVVAAEQIYRAWTIIRKMPYHLGH